MPSYIVERPIPKSNGARAEDLVGIATRVVAPDLQAGRGVVWSKAFVTDGAIYCLYHAHSRSALVESLGHESEPSEVLLELVPTATARERGHAPLAAAAAG